MRKTCTAPAKGAIDKSFSKAKCWKLEMRTREEVEEPRGEGEEGKEEVEGRKIKVPES